MKNKVAFIFMVAMMFIASSTFAQDNMAKKGMTDHAATAQTIKLEQIKGDFTIQGLTLAQGDYVFEVSNNGVDHEVGFVIAPKSNPDAHIKTAYVQKTIKDGEKSTSKVVNLPKGEYVYFCPMNPTPKYTITVK
ncbi:MAG: cupredoxin domain-containing protein [Saprospiraceae bacterium]